MDNPASALWGIVAMNVVTLLTVVIRDLFAQANARRRRTYELEDRRFLAQSVASTARQVASAAAASAEAAAGQLAAHDERERADRTAIAAQLAENTVLTRGAAAAAKEAYREANSVNNKIAAIGLERNWIEAARHDGGAHDE